MFITPGCGENSNQITPPSGQGEVDTITLLANPPVALNLDGLPGDDGVRMYLFCESGKNSARANGSLEMLLYEYTNFTVGKSAADLTMTIPRGKWTYSAETLKTFATKEMYNVPGYKIGLLWDDRTKPRSKRVMVVARYICPSGKVILSSPANFSMGNE